MYVLESYISLLSLNTMTALKMCSKKLIHHLFLLNDLKHKLKSHRFISNLLFPKFKLRMRRKSRPNGIGNRLPEEVVYVLVWKMHKG